MSGLINLKLKIIDVLEKHASSLLLLGIRLYMANIFFKSGKLKLDSYLNDNWDLTVELFRSEHPVPGLPAEIAAYAATAGELILPILLVFGLGARFAAAGLLVMTAVIEFTYKHYEVHEFWALLLAVSLVFGAGKISIDYFIRKKFSNKK